MQGLLRIPSLLGFFLRLSLMQEIRTLHLQVSPVACLSCLNPFSPNAEGSCVWHHLSHSHGHSSYLMVPIHTRLVLPYTSFLLYWLNWSLGKCVEYIHSSEQCPEDFYRDKTEIEIVRYWLNMGADFLMETPYTSLIFFLFLVSCFIYTLCSFCIKVITPKTILS